jgi:hypothetical protein
MAAADRLPTQETMSITIRDGVRHFTLTGDNQKHFKIGDCVNFTQRFISGNTAIVNAKIVDFDEGNIFVLDLNNEGREIRIPAGNPRSQISLRTMELKPCPEVAGGRKSKRRKRRNRKSKKH